MTEEEIMKFCGTTCMAARRLNIYGRFQEDFFVWFDPSANRMRWRTESGKDKKDILYKACLSLVNYLSCPPNQKK